VRELGWWVKHIIRCKETKEQKSRSSHGVRPAESDERRECQRKGGATSISGCGGPKTDIVRIITLYTEYTNKRKRPNALELDAGKELGFRKRKRKGKRPGANCA